MLNPRRLALAAVAVVAVVAGLLLAFGVIDVSKLFGSKEPSTAGLVAVPTPARPIAAHMRITRDHLWDTRAARIAVVYLPPTAVTREMIVNITDVIGRVLDHPKTPGYVFTESDFLPKGTREGIVAGIPAGQRAVRIPADKVEGLYGLHAGDRFDLLATMPIDASRGGGGQSFNVGGLYGQQIALEAQLSNWQKQATVRVMVQNGMIVEEMTTRGVPTFQTSLTEGGATRIRPVQEAVIAVRPADVARLTEAMAVGARITAIPRSGRPDDPIDSQTPDLRPVGPFAAPGGRTAAGSPSDDGQDASSFAFVETIMGQKHTLTAVPRP